MNSAVTEMGPFDFANPRLEPHMIFICPECGQEHNTQQEWRRHLNEDHDYTNKTFQDFDFKEINERYHECLVCHRWVANAHQAIALLQYHRFLHLPHSRTYRCRHCLGAFTRKRALCEHLFRFHSRMLARNDNQQQTKQKPQQAKKQAQRRPPPIKHRSILATRSPALRDPKRNPEFYMRFLCPQCGVHFDRCDQWTQHINTAHAATSTDLCMHRIAGSRNHYCLQCKKLVYSSEKARLQRHRFTHLPHKLYFKCAHCATRKTLKTEMLRHYIFAHASEFEANKAHVRLPDEWGGQASDRLRKEIEQLLLPSDIEDDEGDEDDDKDSAPLSNDLIQKALLDSLIDLENETMAANGGGSGKQKQVTAMKSASEYALDQSLNDLEAILRGDLESNQKSLIQRDAADSQDSNYELEELCAAFFEAEEQLQQQPTQPPPMPKPIIALIAPDEVKIEKIKDEIEEECDGGDADTNLETTLAEEAAEQLVSIEINAQQKIEKIVEGAATNSDTSPKRKRRKLSDSVKVGANSAASSVTVAPAHHDPKSLLETHINYLCPECGCEFAEQSTWREHVFSAHNLANVLETNFKLLENQCSYLCLDCMQVQHTTRNAELQRHRFMHMPFQAYLKCTLCKKTKSSKPKMLLHLQSYHAQLLNATTTLTSMAGAAVKGDKSSPRFKCPHCHKEFMQQSRCQNHRAQCQSRPPRALIARSELGGTTASRIEENLRLLAHLKRARERMRLLRHVEHIGT